MENETIRMKILREKNSKNMLNNKFLNQLLYSWMIWIGLEKGN